MSELIDTQGRALHMGMDSICILRATLGFGEELAEKYQTRAAMPTATKADERIECLKASFAVVMKLMEAALVAEKLLQWVNWSR